jgi:GNAT superfamily N-acetyltransferase
MEYGDVTIRRAVPGDGEALAELRVIMLASIFGNLVSEEVEREINLAYFRAWDGREPFCLVAEAGGRVVGSVASSFYGHFPSARNPTGVCAMVHNLCVLQEWRGRGIGRELMRLILAECLERDAGRVTLYASDMGRGIYKSYGFREERPFCPEMRLYRDGLERLG